MDPWYHAVASTIACDIFWGMGLVTSVISGPNYPANLVRLKSTVEELTMKRLRLGPSTSDSMEQWLYQRFVSVSLREETGRSEASNEILSTNGSCERGLANHPLYVENGLISSSELSLATPPIKYFPNKIFSLELGYLICEGSVNKPYEDCMPRVGFDP